MRWEAIARKAKLKYEINHHIQMNIVITNHYLNLYRQYEKSGFSTELNPNDTELNDDQKNYFQIGRNALDLCVDALVSNQCNVPKAILDFPSGSGRVTRHLVSYFNESTIHACDLYENHLEFCKNRLGTDVFLSHVNPDEIVLPQKYDLIFVGSLLTHLPLTGFDSVIRFIKKHLSERGIALLTFEGRFSAYAQQNLWKFVDDDLFGIAYSQYLKNGFGFVDYVNHQSQFFKQEHYGFALANPTFVIGQIFKQEGLKMISYKEQAWNNHQDCCVVQKIEGYLK
jgi:hypothetical protein